MTVKVTEQNNQVIVSTTGSQGAAGAVGATGPAGTSVLHGSSAPQSSDGNNGDFFIETTNSRLYGPKASGAWPGSYVSLIGPAGATGSQGSTGSQGPSGNDGSDGSDGKSVLSGAGAPSGGTDGDFWIDTTNSRIYGPKASGSWPNSFTSLIGPQGNAGATGSAGSAATIAVGSVTTGAAGSSATVTNSGSSSAATFDFSIPRGDTGPAGADGQDGQGITDGDKGDISVSNTGTVWTIDNNAVTNVKILDDTIAESKLDIHGGGPSGTNKFLGYTANGMEWAVPPDTTYSVGDNGLTKNNFTDALKTKLDGISASANNYTISSDLLDEDNMASDSATKVASQQSIKAYVDAHTGATDLTYTAGTRELASSTGTNVNLPEATTTNAGLQSSADKTKLDGIETSATADQTGSEIKTAYEAEANTNAYTDAEKTKLAAIEASATADQTGAEIKSAYEGESNTNAFTDTEKTKLSGIAASANNYSISSDLLDEDNMSTNSATKVPSQQSVKAYVDANSSDTTYTAGTGLQLSGTQFSVTSLALTTVQEASSESAQLSLTTQEGDIVVRTDENKSYVRNSGTAGTMADFTLLRTPTDAVLSVNGNTGAITAAQIAAAVENATDSNTFSDAFKTKLNAIEANATADQTGAEIKTAYESESDTNAYTDAEKSKLAAIESGATGDQTNAEIRAAVEAASDSNVFTDADHTKLNAIEAGATADQTNAEIRAAVEAASDSNVFTDADHSKLNAIEASATADQTGAEIKTAYEAESDTNAYTDTEKSKLAGIATGAEVNVQANWNETSNSSDAYIQNKPTIPTNTDTTYAISCVDGDNTDEEKIRLTAGGDGSGTDDVVLEAGTGLSVARSGDKITFTNTVTNTNTQLSTEEVQDIIGGMVSSNTETNISVTYDDTNGKLNFASTDTNTTYSVGDGGLTQKNFTTTLKDKLDGIASGAEVNVQSDWNASSGDAQILNKPTIAPTITGTVSGSISANAATSIKSDGTLEETTLATTLLSTPTGVKTFSVSKTAANADTQTNYTTWAYDSDNNKLINFWWSSDKSTLSFQANEVSANGQSITRLGTTESSDALYTSVSQVSTSAIYHPSSGRVLLSYLCDTGGDYGGNWVVRICDFSSGAGTMGSEITIDSNFHSVANSQTNTFCTLAGDKIIIAAESNFGSPTITAYVCSIDSSGNFSKGSAQTIVSGASSLFSWTVEYDSTNSRLVFAYSYFSGGGYKTFTKVGTISSTSITTGSETQIHNYFYRSIALEHNPDDGKMYFIFQDGNSNLNARVGIVASSGNSITMHSAVTAGSGSTYQPKSGDGVEHIRSKYHPVLKEVCFYWVNNSNASYAGTVSSNSSNVTSFTTSTAYNLLGEAANSARGNDRIVFIAYHSESERMIGFSTRDSDKYQAFVSTNHGSATTNSDKFVGFASAAYTNGQTATINVAGNTTTQSSLTPGTTYYIQDNGSLGTSAETTNIVGGVALTSTKLLIEGSSLTSLNASDLGSGTLADARISSLTASKLTGALPAISGANLTNLPAAGGSITATASGSIANGAAVYKKSDGTVSTIATATKMLSKLEKSEITNYISPVEMNAGTEQASLSGNGVAYDATTKCVVVVWGGTDAAAPAANTYYKDVWSNVGVVSGSGKDCKIKWGSPQVIADFSSNNLHNYGPTVCSIGGGKVVIGWKDRTNNNLLAVVATISAANKNVSLGSVVTENNETWGAEQKVLSLGTDKFIMGAGTGGQWNRTDPKFFVGTVSGTTITLQTRSSSAGISSGSVRDWNVNADYDKVFISAEEQSGSNYWATFCAGSISGNSISFGSFTRFTGTYAGGTNRYYGLPIIWDDTNNRLVCWMRIDDWTAQDGIYTSNRYRTLTATVSGTTLTIDGAWQDYTQRVHSANSPQYATDYYTTSQSAIYDPNLGGVVNVMKLQSERLVTPDHGVDDIDPYEIAAKNTGFIRALTGSGSTYTATDDHSIGSPLTQTWGTFYGGYGNVNGVQTQGMSICYDTDNKQVIIVQNGIWNQNDKENRSSSAWAMAIKTFKPTTTASDFIGFAEAAYTNGQTATITTAGGTNESQSGLTIGSSYYLQGNGTLSTTPDTTYGAIFAGIATAATKLVVSQNNKVNLTGVVTSDGDGITDFADKSITSRKLETGNYPYKRGLILTTGGFSENQGDEASDRNDPTTSKRIYEPSSLVWSSPDWELVSYGDDLVLSGGSKSIYTRMFHVDSDYGGTTDKEIGEVWPNHRFYKVVYEACLASNTDADLRLQLSQSGTTLTTNSIFGSSQGAYTWNHQEGIGSSIVNSSNSNTTSEFIRLCPYKNYHVGTITFASPMYSDRFWTCSWEGTSGDSYNTSSGSSGSNYYTNSNLMKKIVGTGGLRIRGSSYGDYQGIVLSTGHSSGFASLTYRVYGMK